MEKHSGNKILVVDDEKLVRLVISAKLKKAGYESVAFGDVAAAVAELKSAPKAFSAIVTDIMMGDMDGFVFRDIVRGISPKIPIFFLTALDPEEGGGFLKKILDDPISYYLPKAVSTDTLINRVRQVVASYRVEAFIQNKIDEDKKSLKLASYIQKSLLPRRALMTPRGFYTIFWRPFDIVSGDLVEAIPFGKGCYLYVLGDIQGHGTSAAIAMTAIQSFLKNFLRTDGVVSYGPEEIANMLQGFFRDNLADVTYMTALICIHRPVDGYVKWLTCGAPELKVIDNGVEIDANPEKRGGMPIGLMQDTVYTAADTVTTKLSKTAVCYAYTDGIMDISTDEDGSDNVPAMLSSKIRCDFLKTAREEGSLIPLPAKLLKAHAELGYDKYHDDITILLFGAHEPHPGMFETTLKLSSDTVDTLAQDVAEWCRLEGWPEDCISRIQLVLEEKLMNIYDHGLDERARLREVVSVRLRKVRETAVLTVWDAGTPEPSISVAAGDSATAFEMANQNMSGRGRGRLIVRELCDGIERNIYPPLNETTYHIPFAEKEISPQAVMEP